MGGEHSAHLLPRGPGGQDVQLGELGRVFLGLEAERGDAGGPAVRRRRRGGRGGGGRRRGVGEDGADVGGVLHRGRGLAEQGCGRGSTRQGAHAGEESEGGDKQVR